MNIYSKLIVILCLSLSLTLFLDTIVRTRQENINLGMEQVKMAEQGRAYTPSGVPYHYKYRVLVPYLVRLLPFEVKQGFKYVSILGCFLTLFCLGLTLYSLNFDIFGITSGMILGAFSYTIIYSLNYPYMPDAMNNALITACFLGLVRKNIVLVALSLVLGFLNHDTAIAYLLLVPLYFSRHGSLFDKKGILYSVCLAGLVIAAKMILIAFLGGEGVYNAYSGHFSFSNIVANWHSKGGMIGASARVYITFHLLWFLALKGFPKSDWRVKRGWLMIIPAILFFIVLSDTRRHLSYLLPVISVTGAYSFVTLGKDSHIKFEKILILGLYVFIALLASQDTVEFFLNFQWPSIIQVNIFAVLGMANLAGLGLIYSGRVRRHFRKQALSHR